MKIHPLIMLTLGCGVLAGCAGMAPPSPAEMAKVPVVRFGTPAPAGQDFALFYPAGTPLPVQTAVTGSLLEKNAQTMLTVALRRDVYAYKQWVSFDGKTWQRGAELIDSRHVLLLPGAKDGVNPGEMSAQFNVK